MAVCAHSVVFRSWKGVVLVLILLANADGMEGKKEFLSDMFWTKDPITEDITMDVTTEDETWMLFTASVQPRTTQPETTKSETTNTPKEDDTPTQRKTTNADVLVLVGEDLSLSCFSSNQNLIERWRKDGNPLVFNDRILKLRGKILVRNVVEGDAGVYKCLTLDSRRNQVASTSVQVTVLHHGLNGKECETVTSPDVLNASEDLASSIERRVGRQHAVKGSAPWMARLFVRGRGFICGGSLIDRQWVVTAAHCFYVTDPPAKEDLCIRLGDHSVLKTEQSEMLIKVEEIYEHEEFNPVTFDNNIALIKLVNPIRAYSDYIRPICVANRSIDPNLMTVGTFGRVNGWGKVTEGG